MATSAQQHIHDIWNTGWNEDEELENLLKLNPADCCYDTFLMKAVNYNWVKCVNKLIELGANVNAVSEHGTTALMGVGSEEVVGILVNNGADVHYVNKKDGRRALSYACYEDLEGVALALLEAGATYNITDQERSQSRNSSSRISEFIVNAIVDQERRRVNEIAQTVDEAEHVKATPGWIYTFLTHHEVPDEVAKSCEEKLLEQGFYSPQILAVTKPSKFQSDYLDSIGVVIPGVQHLLIALQAELHGDRIEEDQPLWTWEMEEAVAVGKKRARDGTEGAK
eukprot:gene9013-10642_t